MGAAGYGLAQGLPPSHVASVELLVLPNESGAVDEALVRTFESILSADAFAAEIKESPTADPQVADLTATEVAASITTTRSPTSSVIKVVVTRPDPASARAIASHDQPDGRRAPHRRRGSARPAFYRQVFPEPLLSERRAVPASLAAAIGGFLGFVLGVARRRAMDGAAAGRHVDRAHSGALRLPGHRSTARAVQLVATPAAQHPRPAGRSGRPGRGIPGSPSRAVSSPSYRPRPIRRSPSPSSSPPCWPRGRSARLSRRRELPDRRAHRSSACGRVSGMGPTRPVQLDDHGGPLSPSILECLPARTVRRRRDRRTLSPCWCRCPDSTARTTGHRRPTAGRTRCAGAAGVVIVACPPVPGDVPAAPAIPAASAVLIVARTGSRRPTTWLWSAKWWHRCPMRRPVSWSSVPARRPEARSRLPRPVVPPLGSGARRARFAGPTGTSPLDREPGDRVAEAGRPSPVMRIRREQSPTTLMMPGSSSDSNGRSIRSSEHRQGDVAVPETDPGAHVDDGVTSRSTRSRISLPGTPTSCIDTKSRTVSALRTTIAPSPPTAAARVNSATGR